MTPTKTASEVLRDAILRCGRSRNRLCEEAGVEPGSISRFVNRQRSIRLDLADRLIEILGLELRPMTTRKGRK